MGLAGEETEQLRREWLVKTERGDRRLETACESRKCNVVHTVFVFVFNNSYFIH